jgi:hypothetical protein
MTVALSFAALPICLQTAPLRKAQQAESRRAPAAPKTNVPNNFLAEARAMRRRSGFGGSLVAAAAVRRAEPASGASGDYRAPSKPYWPPPRIECEIFWRQGRWRQPSTPPKNNFLAEAEPSALRPTHSVTEGSSLLSARPSKTAQRGKNAAPSCPSPFSQNNDVAEAARPAAWRPGFNQPPQHRAKIVSGQPLTAKIPYSNVNLDASRGRLAQQTLPSPARRHHNNYLAPHRHHTEETTILHPITPLRPPASLRKLCAPPRSGLHRVRPPPKAQGQPE